MCSAPYAAFHSPQTDPGLIVGNMPVKKTAISRTFGSKPVNMDPRSGRPSSPGGDVNLPGGCGGGDEDDDHGNGGGEGKSDQMQAVPEVIEDPVILNKPKVNVGKAEATSKSLWSGDRSKKSAPSFRNFCYKPLRAPPPPPQEDDNCWRNDVSPGHNSSSEDDSASDGDRDTETQDAEGLSTFQRMLTPPVSDTNSPPKKQDSEPVQVFVYSGNNKTKPNKYHISHVWIREKPSRHEPSNSGKERISSFNTTKEATKQKSFRDNSLPCDPYNSSSNDGDNENNGGVDSPDSPHTEDSASSTIHVACKTPTTPDRPVARSQSKRLAHEATEHAIDNHDQVTPSSSAPSVKRKRNDDSLSQPAQLVSPACQRPLKRFRCSTGKSQLASPSSLESPNLRKCTRAQQKKLDE